jgi:hypothetical protein
MNLNEEILEIKKIMGLVVEAEDPEKFKNDKDYGYGEGLSLDQVTAKKKALSNAKLDLIKKQGKNEANISAIKTIVEKLTKLDNQFKVTLVIQGTVS